VPTPPPHECVGSDAAQTVAAHPELFRIVTPIDVDRFEQLLEDHPNPEFVASVCRALREGFGPGQIPRTCPTPPSMTTRCSESPARGLMTSYGSLTSKSRKKSVQGVFQRASVRSSFLVCTVYQFTRYPNHTQTSYVSSLTIPRVIFH
ncbi:hypothetical protein M405DRAFT_926293, partial [Rhizopogon salebrosus TDB-379]